MTAPRTTRRAALASLAGLGATVTLPAIAKAMPAHDPIPALYAERQRAIGLIDSATSEPEADALMDVWGACDRAAIASPATTLAGAAASLKWMRDELMRFGFDAEHPDRGTGVILALLDGALAVLRQEGSAK